jgi:spore germination cell wall hydrolase CwlJ-like protein
MVMSVLLNRIDDRRFPNEACEVVFQHKQFSWTIDLIYKEVKNVEQWQRLYKIAEYAFMNKELVQEMSQGATHYHATSVTPYWVDGNMKHVARVDKHIFYRWEGRGSK